MALVPEFLVLIGICIFLAASLLSGLLNDDLPRPLPYVFQVAALSGLGEIFLSQGFFISTRFWVGVAYLALSLSSSLSLDLYLGLVRHKVALSSAFSAAVVVPFLMVSAVFVTSFLGSGGAVSLSTNAMVTLGVLTFVASVSIFGFLRELSRHTISRGGQISSSSVIEQAPLQPPGIDVLRDLSLPLEAGWEESSKKQVDGS